LLNIVFFIQNRYSIRDNTIDYFQLEIQLKSEKHRKL
ncbi:unnamed protein product, partial [marine sediment metagenome]